MRIELAKSSLLKILQIQNAKNLSVTLVRGDNAWRCGAGRGAVSTKVQRTWRSEQLWRLWRRATSHLVDREMCQRICRVLDVTSLYALYRAVRHRVSTCCVTWLHVSHDVMSSCWLDTLGLQWSHLEHQYTYHQQRQQPASKPHTRI